jgi:plastocyanin
MKSSIWSLALLLTASLLFAVNATHAGEITGKVHAVGVRDNANAVIFIEEIPGKKFPPPKEHAEMDQIHLSFSPHVLPILAGTTVDFLNSDNVLHNVFSPDACAGKFNLGSWPQGQKRSYTFTTAGCRAVLLCNVHPEMEGWIVVLGTPWYAVSAKDGAYAIKDVPAGTYTLGIWHETLKGTSEKVTVPAKGAATVNFEIKR